MIIESLENSSSTRICSGSRDTLCPTHESVNTSADTAQRSTVTNTVNYAVN